MYMHSDSTSLASDPNTMSSLDVIRRRQPLPPTAPEEQQLSIDEISSPISARILEFCDPDLFPETLQNSEVTSSSNNCCYEENSSSYPLGTSDVSDSNNNCNSNNKNTTTNTTTTATATATAIATTNNNNNINIFESSEEEITENDISASIDFSSSSQSFSVPSSLQFDFPNTLQAGDSSVVNGLAPHYPAMAAPLSVFEEDCMVSSVSVPSYVPLNRASSSCTYLGAAGIGAYMPPPAGPINANAFPPGTSGIYGRTILPGSELQAQDLEFQAENGGIYCPDSIRRVFNPPDLQALGSESQQLVGGPGSSTTLTPEISNLEDSTFKVGKLSVEQRKEKIDRYMKKRNERNFNKKIKYACRKTLADSRPRVRGRFAKNDEFGENHRPASSNHEEEDEEEVVVKEEDDMVDSSDIFAYISGVNSFKCNQSIQSWI